MSPGPVVLKFGGTSVADAEAIGQAGPSRRRGAPPCARRGRGVGAVGNHRSAAAPGGCGRGGRRGGGGRRARRAPAAARAGRAPGGAGIGGPASAHRGRRGRAPQPAARDRHLEGPVAAHPRRGGRLRRAPEQPHRRSGLPGGGASCRLDRSATRADHQRHVRLCAAVDGGDHRGRDRAPRAARRRRPRAGHRRIRRRHAVRRDHDARPWRVGLLGGHTRRGARRQRDSDLDRRRRHDDGRPARRRLYPRRAAAVVRGSLGAGVFRREGPAPEHDSARRLEEHPGQDPEQPPVRRRRHADHRRARRSTSRSPRSPASATSRSSTSPRRAC